MRSCETCCWREVIITETEDGELDPASECRRNPPTVVLWGDELTTFWPQVAGNEWCGEWSPTS